jgi:hypothetical protein
MELKTKYFTFKTGKNSEEVINKTFVRDVNTNINVADDFYTSIINTYGIKNSRDLLVFYFNTVSEINSIVTYIAQKGADIPRKHVKILKDGTEENIGKSDYIKLLNKPNTLQDGRVFTINAISYFLVTGFMAINKVKPIGWDISKGELFVLPSNYFYPIPLKSVNIYGMPPSGQDFRINPIVKYRLFIDNQPKDFLPEEIIMINDSTLDFDNGNYLRGQSRIAAAIRAVESLSYLYDTVNTLLTHKGAEGFLSKIARPNQPTTAISPTERLNIEKKLYSYGTTGGRNPIGVTSEDLKWLRISVPVSEFMPIELKEHEFRTLGRTVLLNDKEGAIYNNVSLAQEAFYTDCLQPIVNQYYKSLSTGLGLTKINQEIKADWSSIECLRGDKKLEAETKKVNDELWKGRYEGNLITLNEYLTAIGLPTMANGNMYSRDNKDIPLAVRIGVGGTQSLQAILSDNNLTPEQKNNIIQIVFGISPEEAEKLSGSNKPINTQNAIVNEPVE